MDNLNKINGNKDLYDRICGWMAEIEDPESVTDDEEAVTLAMQIMYDIYQTCNDN